MTNIDSSNDELADERLTLERLDELEVSYDPPPEQLCQYCGKPLEQQAVLFGKRAIWLPRECGCSEEKAARATAEAREQAERRRVRKKALHDVGILPRYQDAVLDDPAAVTYLSRFNEEPGDGLYIIGVCGSGKTSLACAVAQALFEARRRVLVTTAIDMLQEIQDTFDNDISTKDVVSKYISCALLVIDDMGKESASDWATRTLFQILNGRYGEMRSTIITSEYEPPDLARRLSRKGFGDPAAAILSRLSETCRIINRPDVDFRNFPGGYSEYQKTRGTQ